MTPWFRFILGVSGRRLLVVSFPPNTSPSRFLVTAAVVLTEQQIHHPPDQLYNVTTKIRNRNLVSRSCAPVQTNPVIDTFRNISVLLLAVDQTFRNSRHFCTSSSSSGSPSPSSSASDREPPPPTAPDPLVITIRLSLSFSNGYFSLRFASRECVFHFWSPVELVLKMFQEELASAGETDQQLEDRNLDGWDDRLEIQIEPPGGELPPFHQIKFGRIEMVAEHIETETTEQHPGTEQCPKSRYRLARLMPFGYALLGCDDLDEVYFVGIGTAMTKLPDGPDGYQPYVMRPLRIRFKLLDKTRTLKIDLETWHERNPLDSQTMLFKAKSIDPDQLDQNELAVRDFLWKLWTQTNRPKHTNIPKQMITYQFLQQERQLLLEKFQPLQQEFAMLVQMARKESRRKFKFGGLFLLSAQLGFVGRLTYFEYSWDIMEPVTWIMTYATMVGSFAYYIVTSEEYVVPMVEKRMIVSRFWKLAQARNFDVKQYKELKERLSELEKRIRKLRARF